MSISDWSSDVCSSDLEPHLVVVLEVGVDRALREAELVRRVPADVALLNPAVADPVQEAALVLQRLVRVALRETVRSEERRVGKACVSTFRARWSPDH